MKSQTFLYPDNSNGSVYLFLNHNQIVLLKSACTARKAAQLITFDKFKKNVFLHVCKNYDILYKKCKKNS